MAGNDDIVARLRSRALALRSMEFPTKRKLSRADAALDNEAATTLTERDATIERLTRELDEARGINEMLESVLELRKHKILEAESRATTAERDLAEARAEVERLDKLLDEAEDAMDRARSELLLVSQDPKYARNVAKDDRMCVDAATCILNAAIHEIEHAALAKGGADGD